MSVLVSAFYCVRAYCVCPIPFTSQITTPTSRSAAWQAFEAKLKARVKDAWKRSPRYQKTRDIDKALPGPGFLRMTAKLPRRNTSVLMQLRTGHVPLNGFLHKIGQVPESTCPGCELERETVTHYLTACPWYDGPRSKILIHFRQHSISKKVLLSNPKAQKLLHQQDRKVQKTYGTCGVTWIEQRGGRMARMAESRR